MRRVIPGGLAVTLLALSAACTPIMSWRAQPPAPTLTGKATVVVTDKRRGPQGGDDPSVIGSERGAFFVASAVRLSEPTEAADRMRELVTQAALTAGIGVVGGTGGARIALDVHDLWCEGVVMAYTKARLVGVMAVLGPDGAPRTPSMPVQVEAGGGDCKRAYQHMLSNAFSEVTSLLSSPAVKAAVGP